MYSNKKKDKSKKKKSKNKINNKTTKKKYIPHLFISGNVILSLFKNFNIHLCITWTHMHKYISMYEYTVLNKYTKSKPFFKFVLLWFASLFNDISVFVGDLMPKQSSKKDRSGTN